jgi:hypothetical protein
MRNSNNDQGKTQFCNTGNISQGKNSSVTLETVLKAKHSSVTLVTVLKERHSSAILVTVFKARRCSVTLETMAQHSFLILVTVPDVCGIFLGVSGTVIFLRDIKKNFCLLNNNS